MSFISFCFLWPQALYLIQPHCLRGLDIDCIARLSEVTAVIPLLAKVKHMQLATRKLASQPSLHPKLGSCSAAWWKTACASGHAAPELPLWLGLLRRCGSRHAALQRRPLHTIVNSESSKFSC